MSHNQGRAETYYRKHRDAAYRKVERGAGLDELRFRAGPINGATLSAWETQWTPSFTGSVDYGEWNWVDRRREFRSPSRFEVALWCGTELCGMAIGKLSAGRTIVGVHYMERRRSGINPLAGHVMYLVSACASEYALMLGSKAVRFWRPAPGLIDKYATIGFHDTPPRGGLPGFCESVL